MVKAFMISYDLNLLFDLLLIEFWFIFDSILVYF